MTISLIISFHFWSFLVISGYFWSFLVISGHFWSFLIISNRSWRMYACSIDFSCSESSVSCLMLLLWLLNNFRTVLKDSFKMLYSEVCADSLNKCRALFIVLLCLKVKTAAACRYLSSKQKISKMRNHWAISNDQWWLVYDNHTFINLFQCWGWQTTRTHDFKVHHDEMFFYTGVNFFVQNASEIFTSVFHQSCLGRSNLFDNVPYESWWGKNSW